MIGYLGRRTLHALVAWIAAVSLVFIAVRILPGNPLLSRFGQHPDAAQIETLRRENGWDRSLPVQLVEFLTKFLTTGDLGASVARSGGSIGRELRERIPATLELTLAAVMIGIPLGVLSGVISANARGGRLDYLCQIPSLIGVSVPVFFIALVLRETFTFLPTSQRLPPTAFDFEPITGLFTIDTLLRGRLDLFGPVLLHLLLPAITLATVPAASIAKITRASMIETLRSDYIRTAAAKGASRFRILTRHALANAAVPIVNIGGLQVGLLLSGAVLTETVFAWPGLGKYLTDAVVNDRDYAAVQAGAIVIAGIFVTMNLLLDFVFVLLDPRVRFDAQS